MVNFSSAFSQTKYQDRKMSVENRNYLHIFLSILMKLCKMMKARALKNIQEY